MRNKMTSNVELEFKLKFNNEKLEFYKRYKESIEISLNNINRYLQSMEPDIKRLKYYIDKNQFPINDPKECQIYTLNSEEINQASSKYIIDKTSVFSNPRKNIQSQYE